MSECNHVPRSANAIFCLKSWEFLIFCSELRWGEGPTWLALDKKFLFHQKTWNLMKLGRWHYFTQTHFAVLFTDTPLFWVEEVGAEQKTLCQSGEGRNLCGLRRLLGKKRVMKDLVRLLSYEVGAPNCNSVWTMLFRIEATWGESTSLDCLRNVLYTLTHPRLQCLQAVTRHLLFQKWRDFPSLECNEQPPK